MSEYCDCEDWKKLVDSYDLVVKEAPYGWILKWTQLTKEKGYTQVHRYGIPIKYCPMCGKKLLNN